ncbi:MAG TPA: choice-of-anchor R domain-containing protein [Candidatus Paceibacterota bacterium]|nr:choice-of-anchor R domain-containing protein [Candidatus Paceibacterota bacterium]
MKKIYETQKGFALMTALIFVLVGGAVIVGGIADAVSREVKTVRNESNSKQSYYTSESSLEDSIYRIKNSKQIGSVETLAIGTTKATSTIVTGSDGDKQIDSASDVVGTNRTTEATLDITAGVSFPFVLQGGVGGIDLNSGSVTGDIYTTGSIRGCGFCSISGLATAAGGSSADLDQDNSSPSTPTNSISFASTTNAQDFAQSFTVSQTLSIADLQLYIKKVGSPSNATIRITTNSSGSPSNTVLASGTLSSSLVSTSYSWEDITLTANPILTMGTTYWIVIDANNNSSNYYVIAANNNAYSSGSAKLGKYNTSWSNVSPATLDAYFRIYIGTNQTSIEGIDSYTGFTVGSAYGYNVSNVTSSGVLYCQTGSENNKACDTSRGDPPIEQYPAADSTITGWKATAAAGGTYSGNRSVDWSGATIGPQKISGNLTVSGGGTLVVSGIIWVTGDVTINGGATVMPQGTGKSFAIISDGKISLNGGASITGSSGNGHILLVSTNTADPAITINGGANDTVVFVPYGGLLITGGATAKAASAKHITTDGGANLIYDPSVASLNLTGGTTEGSFGIKTWKETQ